MQEKHEWEKRYEQKRTPWDTGRPDSHLVQLIATWPNTGGRVLEIGCGSGTNAVWLAGRGFQVTGMDISSGAIELAKQRAEQSGAECCFIADDFLARQANGTFELLFDRGCFHCMGTDERRNLFVSHAAACLEPGGLWFSLLGNSDQHSRWKEKGRPGFQRRKSAPVLNQPSRYCGWNPVFLIPIIRKCSVSGSA